MYHVGYNEKNERNIQAWLDQSQRANHPAPGHIERQWVHEISDDEEAMAQIPSVFQSGGVKSQNTPPLDLSVFEKGSRQAESPLDLSVKTRKRCADSTDIEELQRRRGVRQGDPLSSKRLCLTQVGEQRRIPNYQYEVKTQSEGYLAHLPQTKPAVSKYPYLPAAASPLIQSSQQHVGQSYQGVQGYPIRSGLTPAGQAGQSQLGQYHPSHVRQLEGSRSYDPSQLSGRSHSVALANRRSSDELKQLQKSETTALQGFYEPSEKHTLTVNATQPDFSQTKRTASVEQPLLIMPGQIQYQESLKRNDIAQQRINPNLQTSPYQNLQGKQVVISHDSRGIMQQQQQKQLLQQRKLHQSSLEQRSPLGHESNMYSPYLSHQASALQKVADRDRVAMIASSNMGIMRGSPQMENSAKHMTVIAESAIPSNTHHAYQHNSVKSTSELRADQSVNVVDRSRNYPNTYTSQKVRNTPAMNNAFTLRQSYAKTEQLDYSSGYGSSKVIGPSQPSMRTNLQGNIISPGSSHIPDFPVKHESRPDLQRPVIHHPGHSVIQRQTGSLDARPSQERTASSGMPVGSSRPYHSVMYERMGNERRIITPNSSQSPRFNIEHKDNRTSSHSKDPAYINKTQTVEQSAPKTRQLAFHTSRGREISLVSESPEILPGRLETMEPSLHYDSNERRLSRQHRLSLSHQIQQNNNVSASQDGHNITSSRRSSVSSQSSRKSFSRDFEMHEQPKSDISRSGSLHMKPTVSETNKKVSSNNLYSEASNARLATEMILPMAEKFGFERSITKGTSGLQKDMKGMDFISTLLIEELKRDTEPPKDCFKNRSLLDEIDRSATSSPVKMEHKNGNESNISKPDSSKEETNEFKNPSVLSTTTCKSETASYTLPLQIAIPGSKATVRTSVISSVQSEKAPKVWSRKHMILSQFKQDEDLKNTVNIDLNEKIPVESSKFVPKKGTEKSQTEMLACPPSPKMPILSPQEKQRITPMVSPATGEPPNLVDNNSSSNISNAQGQSEQTPVKEIKNFEQHLHKLISEAVKSQGSFDKEKVCETVYRLTSQPQPHKPFLTRQLSASKNIPVANVAPFVHGKFSSSEFKISESGDGSSGEKPETEVKNDDMQTFQEEKKSQGMEVVDDLERSTSLGKYPTFESPSHQDVVCNYVNVDTENRFKASDIDLEHSNSSFSTQNFSTLFDDELNDGGISPVLNKQLIPKHKYGKEDDSSIGFLSNLPKVSTSPKHDIRNVFGAFDEKLSDSRIASDGEEKYESDEEESSRLSDFKLDSNAGYEGDDEGKKDKHPKGKAKQSNTRQKADKLVKKALLSKNLKVDGSKNTVKSRLQRKNLMQKGFVDFMPEVLPQRTRTGRRARSSLRSGKVVKARVSESRRSSSQNTVKGKKSVSVEKRSNSLERTSDLKKKSKSNVDSESIIPAHDAFTYYSDTNDLDTGTIDESLKGIQSEKGKWRIKGASSSAKQTLRSGKSKGGLMVKLSLRALQPDDDESTDEEYFQNYENKFKTFASDSETKKEQKKSSVNKKKKGFHFKQKYIFQKKRRPKGKGRGIPLNTLTPCEQSDQPDLDELYSFHEEGYELHSLPSTSVEVDVTSQIPIPLEVKRMTVNKDTGETLLHRAARMGYVEVALYCLATGNVDVNARDNAGYTSLHECCVRGHRSVAIQLLKYGADVNCCSVDGIRPIHDAVENDRLEMVRLLLSYGADPTISTYAGRTPLKIARTERMKYLLLCYIADLNGYTPEIDIEEKPWQFHTSSTTLDGPEEEGSAIFYDIPSDPEDEMPDLCNFSNQPLFTSQRIIADGGKRVEDYILLEDVLRGYRVNKKELDSQGVSSHLIKTLTKQVFLDSKKDSIYREYFDSKPEEKALKVIRCVDAAQIIHKIEKHIASSTHGSHRTKS